MTQEQRKITECLNDAIDKFNSGERYLISRDLSERCICAKFASYLEKTVSASEFSQYIVDVEYNRGSKGNEYAAKMLQGKKIVVDLIVHKRGYSAERGFDNLFCIEMKKSYSRCNMSADKSRLQMLTDGSYGFGYRAGFMVVIDASKKIEDCKLRIESSYYNSLNR